VLRSKLDVAPTELAFFCAASYKDFAPTELCIGFIREPRIQRGYKAGPTNR
jgi:hypothetical protein